MITIHRSEALVARTLRCVPLTYCAGADPAQDRPAHVRAASGVCVVGGRLVVVQDDAAFLAVVDPADLTVEAVALPAGADSVRQWDDLRGNKAGKPDLEACVTLGADALIGFGSGSTPARERILHVSGMDGNAPRPRWIHLPRLYAALRQATDFSGSEMNVEGAVVVGDVLRLFNRGNGAPAGGLQPVDASCDLDLAAVRAHLADPAGTPPPLPRAIVRYALGTLGGARLGFTDAAATAGGVVFAAAAEESPDTYRDGAVTGSAIGWLGAGGGAWAPLLRADGTQFDGKIEGIAPGRTGRLWAVADRDDPRAPAELCEIALSGDWPLPDPVGEE